MNVQGDKHPLGPGLVRPGPNGSYTRSQAGGHITPAAPGAS